MLKRTRSKHLVAGLVCSCAIAARADFQPIALSADSYNQDMIVEKTAPPPVLPVTTASMDTGVQNSGFSWFELGYTANYPTAGLPTAGSTFTSEKSADHQYRMAPSYTANNAVLIDVEHPTALIRFFSPSNYTAVSFLTSTGAGNNEIGYSIRHEDGSRQSGTFTSFNWYSPLDPAWGANGRVNTTSFALSDLNGYNPKLYPTDISISNPQSRITDAELYLTNGVGHTTIFAVSGSPVGGGPFMPMEIGGYNQDMVVEAAALKPGFIETNTTATMDNGAANLRFTWYEQGYNTQAPESGLPSAGTVITSDTVPGHSFIMAPSYTDRNAILLDNLCTNSVLTLITPARYSALSFLTASAFGPLTNQCIVVHADGSCETNGLVSPDWLGQTPGVLATHGRVSVSTRLIDHLGVDSPQLYATDVPVTNQTNAVTKIILRANSCLAQSRAVVLAVSGNPTDSTAPRRPSLTITKNADGSLDVHSSLAGTLESCTSLVQGKASWNAVAPITSTLRVTNNSVDKVRFYRVVIR